MNINIIEDIARLPQEFQTDAYKAIKASEMEKKEALKYLRSIKIKADSAMASEDINDLAVPGAGQTVEQTISDNELRVYLKKIDRDLDRLATKAKGSTSFEKENVVPVLESMIEKLYVLCSSLRSPDTSPGKCAQEN